MGRGKKIDRVAVHRYLWENSDRLNRFSDRGSDTAANLEIGQFTFSRILGELAKEGRIKHVSSKYHNVKVWSVRDPATFEGTNP